MTNNQDPEQVTEETRDRLEADGFDFGQLLLDLVEFAEDLAAEVVDYKSEPGTGS